MLSRGNFFFSENFFRTVLHPLYFSPLDNYNYNDVDELGNISWANNLRRNASFIDAIFMFQLKSNLTCEKCKNKKYNFESSYVFDLPLSLFKKDNEFNNDYHISFEKVFSFKTKFELEQEKITEEKLFVSLVD